MTKQYGTGIRTTLVAVGVVFMAACGPGAVSYDTAGDIAQALQEAEVDCASVETLPEATLVSSGASCASGPSTLELYVFRGEEDLGRWLRVSRQLGPVAVGPNWAIRGDDAATAEAAAALHGRVEASE